MIPKRLLPAKIAHDLHLLNHLYNREHDPYSNASLIGRVLRISDIHKAGILNITNLFSYYYYNLLVSVIYNDMTDFDGLYKEYLNYCKEYKIDPTKLWVNGCNYLYSNFVLYDKDGIIKIRNRIRTYHKFKIVADIGLITFNQQQHLYLHSKKSVLSMHDTSLQDYLNNNLK